MKPRYPYFSNYNTYGYRPLSTMYNYGQPYSLYRNYPLDSNSMEREKSVKGHATWSEGGKITKCSIPWSHNEFMTTAVGSNSPYKCGEVLLVKNLANNKEIKVTVVDEIRGYPSNRISLHRKAFEALGANLDEGIINIEIMPAPVAEAARGDWGNYLLNVARAAFPQYNITGYQTIDQQPLESSQVQHTYDYFLESYEGTNTIRGNVIIDSSNNQVLSIDLKEVMS